MIYPMFAMIMLTFFIGLYTFYVRVQSVRRREVNYRAYLLMKSEQFPEQVQKAGRSFNNQFEIPMLFYVVCLAFLALDINSEFALVMAWVFFGLRVVHAGIHLTYNHLMHRFSVFWMSALAALAMWINLVLNIA
ncbi:MAPEG family protein [Reinekea marina]|uniref:MAPEG family protein n=1 Tax=Reinekea marina TaxID=1310421 RepID=A0ABV7WQ44_9GAMM|nr:MAPEG family protein [Reinekea marina]MBU2863179.1 MAPEG family protein [Reinekea forsetii]MDN3649383.1 MAPEG family protein [Reinekea marina]